MTVGFAGEAVRLRDRGHLSVADIARATGAESSSVRAWLNDTRTPSGDRAERLVELSSVVERLADFMEGEYIPVWLRKPNLGLAERKPIDVIASGGYREVSALLASIESTPVS
ncbi:MAG: antitoxin Xre/MbcA/ParS toxin-binding domain-containing protein [Solirubrobacterales bacterium]